ncbi:C40 family peptidase [Cohnella fermenti]|uniref:NlpC/P60 family protein n=1 Tax=Cohnella fermenti TaxID=2565925 RepID=A0A4S4C239_9BACL|nr:C40 family peptidase [Cohnella fermenti]THF81743.1 NlpC/P60 family protein [Cohnella fermenti]
MRKKLSAVFAGLVLLLAFQAGSAFAESKLDTEVSKLIGIDYDYGGTTTSGFDCSGFTAYVFKKLGMTLPHSSAQQFKLGDKVAKADLQAGDLVFFNTSGKGVSHVGVYVGDNKFAHAASKGVTISGLDEKYYAARYLGARRVMSEETYKKVTSDSAAVL